MHMHACTTGWIKFILIRMSKWTAYPITCMTAWTKFIFIWLMEWPAYPISMHRWLDQVYSYLPDGLIELYDYYTRTRATLIKRGSRRTNLILEHVRTYVYATNWMNSTHAWPIDSSPLTHGSIERWLYWSAATFWPVMTPEEISRCSIILWEASLVSQNWLFRPFS